MFVINSFFDFQILQLGMMGTSVLYCSGDTGVAGGPDDTSDTAETLCLNSKRVGPLKCYLALF